MIQVDLPAAFTVGHVFALLSKNYLKKEPNMFASRLLGPLNFYLSCGFVPVGLFLLIGWPSWETMYATAWIENPFNRPLAAGFYVLFMVLMILLGNIGFILAHHWYRKGKDRLVIYGSITAAILAFLPFLLRWGIWWKIGAYAQVKSGEGYSFWEPPFILGWVFIMSYLVIVTVITGLWFKKEGSQF